MKKAVIACLNSKYVHMSSAPWCLFAGVRERSAAQINCEVVEGTINGDIDAFADSIAAKRPDIVAFCCYIWNIKQTLYVCERIKAQLGCVTLLGGPEVAYRARDVLLGYSFVDLVLSGEGEYCFPELLDALFGAGELSAVSALTYREDGRIISTPDSYHADTPPSPVTDEYLAAVKGRICYIESSRGCPYRCAFCLSGRVSRLRFFDMDRVKSDILKLSVSGTRTVKFVDRTFNASEAHANEILSFIKDNYALAIPKGICFHFEIAGDILKESTLQILAQMPPRSVQLEIGMQSFNEDTLSAVNRKTDTARLIKNIKRLLSFGNMHIHIDLIAGLTGEDMQSFRRSFNIGYGLGAQMLQMGFLKLLHGADMRSDRQAYPCTFDDEPPYEVTSTPWLSENELAQLKKAENALDRLYNSGRFLFTVEYILSVAEMTPFDLFFDFGNAVAGDGMELGDYAVAVYEHFKGVCDADILRERIVCDLLCCCSALQIPAQLKFIDPLHKKAKSMFGKSIKVAVLPKSGRLFTADHGGERDLFGRYPHRYYDIDMLNAFSSFC